jgi:hypothetical protein
MVFVVVAVARSSQWFMIIIKEKTTVMAKQSSFLRYFLACLVAVLAGAIYQYVVVLQRWRYVDNLPWENFKMADFQVKYLDDIQTTYYSAGKLGDVLPEVLTKKYDV